MNIEHISVSRLQCYELCQFQYKAKYHLKLVSDVPTPFYFTFGKLVHTIIDHHTQAKGEKSISRVKSEVLSGQIDLEPGVKAPHLDNEHHKNLTRHLNNYMRLADKIGYDGETEWPFHYDLDPPHQRRIKGFIDRLIIKNGSACIIDYKTTKPSRWRKDHTTITKDLQLAVYAYVVMNEFGIPAKNIKTALYYLDDAKICGARFSEKTLMAVPGKLVEAYKEIQTLDPDHAKGHVGEHCRRCDWRKHCPFYSLL